jgi:hypothetical protein
MTQRFVIGFGCEYDRDGNPLYLSHRDVARLIEKIAAHIRVPGYSLRFGPGAWETDAGTRIVEDGGTVEYIGPEHDYTLLRAFASGIREELRQVCVVFYAQPVVFFEYV